MPSHPNLTEKNASLMARACDYRRKPVLALRRETGNGSSQRTGVPSLLTIVMSTKREPIRLSGAKLTVKPPAS